MSKIIDSQQNKKLDIANQLNEGARLAMTISMTNHVYEYDQNVLVDIHELLSYNFIQMLAYMGYTRTRSN